jgi:hypothetical protein
MMGMAPSSIPQANRGLRKVIVLGSGSVKHSRF